MGTAQLPINKKICFKSAGSKKCFPFWLLYFLLYITEIFCKQFSNYIKHIAFFTKYHSLFLSINQKINQNTNFSILILTVCSCHVTYAFQSESTLHSCLNVKEILARSRREIWSLNDCNWTRTQSHLVRKRTLFFILRFARFFFSHVTWSFIWFTEILINLIKNHKNWKKFVILSSHELYIFIAIKTVHVALNALRSL